VAQNSMLTGPVAQNSMLTGPVAQKSLLTGPVAQNSIYKEILKILISVFSAKYTYTSVRYFCKRGGRV
jgi:hypothetical protein